MDRTDSVKRAAEAIAAADAILIGAGAGMGVDSGLPDFRGDEGFWKAYPPLKHLGISFVEMANPVWFMDKPEMAWAFYGHRLNLYRETVPHQGFSLLNSWASGKQGGSFVFTSNVDGQFQRAGFAEEKIYECHGSIHHLQCLEGCDGEVRPAEGVYIDVNLDDMTVAGEIPACASCGSVTRPNILMFNDWSWLPQRTNAQEERLGQWLDNIGGGGKGKLAIVECGAGTAVPTVRMSCQAFAARYDARLIRINPREPHGPDGTISIDTPALEGLRLIDEEIKSP
ncbi:MAG: Sir2 family NAD-dependent protein deacetylase [Thermodesulfobacteriota bacterium]